MPGANSIIWIYVLVGLIAAMHLSMLLGRSINWDEFWFYSQVEQVARGEFIQPLQTIHTRFFAWWLPDLAGNEIDHIIIARLFMLACLAVTVTGIFLTAEKFSDKRKALIAVAAYLGTGFVLQHGTSFRVDPIVTACLTSGFAIAARTRLSSASIMALGALIGLAAMVTIKMILWAPAFAGIALWRWEEERYGWRYPVRWMAAGMVALAMFALLYLLHGAGMGLDTANNSASRTLSRSAQSMFSLADAKGMARVVRGVLSGLPFFGLAAIVPIAVLKSDRTLAQKVALIAMWLPVLTPLFYRNAFPYFYAFILPSVAIITVFAIPILLRRFGNAIVVGVIGGCALMVWIVDARSITERQHTLVDAVHKIFPEPVSYFDCCGMIAGFDKANDFRSKWGIRNYLASGRPKMLETMRKQPVPLMLDNKREYSLAITEVSPAKFHPQDYAALRETYVKFWGDVYVAGRQLEPGSKEAWEVLVPGNYTVHGEMVVDDRPLANGSLIELERGVVVLANPGNRQAKLVWGEYLEMPQAPTPEFYWTVF
ncbi:MAG: glycosyltransferase family 39 protein [Pseudomonadota bacterium]